MEECLQRSDFDGQDARLGEHELHKALRLQSEGMMYTVTYCDPREQYTLYFGVVNCLTEARHCFESTFLYLYVYEA